MGDKPDHEALGDQARDYGFDVLRRDGHVAPDESPRAPRQWDQGRVAVLRVALEALYPQISSRIEPLLVTSSIIQRP